MCGCGCRLMCDARKTLDSKWKEHKEQNEEVEYLDPAHMQSEIQAMRRKEELALLTGAAAGATANGMGLTVNTNV